MALRHVAPAGAPIALSDAFASLATWIGRRNHRDALQSALQARLGVRACQVVGTGRAGLTVLLRALRTLSGSSRDEVIIPAYTCYSVAASVVKAGLVPRLADIVPVTLDFDYERLRRADFRRVLAVVATNLYGLPNDLAGLGALAREHGVFVVDDAAQALGAHVGGRLCGTLGDAGLYSFDKGKNVSAIDGGAIVTNDPRIAESLAAETALLPPASTVETVEALIKLAAYVALLRPRLYWIPNSLPLLGLGRTVFDTTYRMARQPAALAALALTALSKVEEFTRVRQRHAAALLESFRGIGELQTITPLPDSDPVYVRLPLLLNDRETRETAIAALNRAGIGATGSYPTSIADIPQLQAQLRGDVREASGARAVANRIITLPTHPYVTERDTALAVDILLDTVAAGSRVRLPREAVAKAVAR